MPNPFEAIDFGDSGQEFPIYDTGNTGSSFLDQFPVQDRKSWYQQMTPESLNEVLNTGQISLPEITQDFNALFGTNYSLDQASQFTGVDAPFNPTWDVPLNKFPQSSSSQSSRSFSGIDWGRPVAKGLLDQILSSAQALPGQAKALPRRLNDYFRMLMQEALGPGAFQGTLNNLAARNMIDSSVASDALSEAAIPIMRDVGQRGFQAVLEGLKSEMQVPGMLGQIASLDQISEAFSGGSSSSSNPLAPYEIMARLSLGA